jgi:hypothetical protein
MIEKMQKAKKKHNWMAGFTISGTALDETERYIMATRMDRRDRIAQGKNTRTFKNY